MTTKVKMQRWNPDTEGELTEKKMRHKLEQQGYSVNRYVYTSGTYFPDHTHEVDKIDAVLSGHFRMTIGDQTVVLEAGDCLYVPQGATHSAEVVGADSVVSLDAIRCT